MGIFKRLVGWSFYRVPRLLDEAEAKLENEEYMEALRLAKEASSEIDTRNPPGHNDGYEAYSKAESDATSAAMSLDVGETGLEVAKDRYKEAGDVPTEADLQRLRENHLADALAEYIKTHRVLYKHC